MIMESVVGRRYCESDIMTLTASVRRAASRRGRHVGTVRERRRRRRRRGRGARGGAARHAAGHAARARHDTGGVAHCSRYSARHVFVCARGNHARLKYKHLSGT